MLPAGDLFNRFLLHARHVLRAVASGQGACATSGRAAIGGRGAARGARRRALGGCWLAGCCDDRRGGRLRCMRGLELA